MPESLGVDFINRVLATSEGLLRESQHFFRPLGVTEAQFNVLNVLAHAPAGLSQRELGDVLVVDRSNVTGLLDRLEKAGWVRREDHPQDRRIHRVMLTAKGRQLWTKVWPLYVDAVEKVVAGLANADIKHALASLAVLEEGAKKWGREMRA
ncbi:MAG TPA: MarR family transcriptional regulator [Opitutaceae bacterium]|jgi:DNA-binding MarR family transcriptional regulator|nr:MarR family transcriptional regulator [Opitutaceae bacterium]